MLVSITCLIHMDQMLTRHVYDKLIQTYIPFGLHWISALCNSFLFPLSIHIHLSFTSWYPCYTCPFNITSTLKQHFLQIYNKCTVMSHLTWQFKKEKRVTTQHEIYFTYTEHVYVRVWYIRAWSNVSVRYMCFYFSLNWLSSYNVARKWIKW